MDEQLILKMYENNVSTHEIARQMGTYPNKINRILRKFGIEPRTRKEAQTIALTKREHPTKGKKRTNEEKLKISQSSSEYWKKMSDDERERRSKISKQQWDSMTTEQKYKLRKSAAAAVRRASKEGSKIEKILLDALVDEGYNVLFHDRKLLAGKTMEIDFFLPEISTVIEIDGPTHFEPIWGESNLQKTVKSDAEKSGLILAQGMIMVRIKYKIKNLTLAGEKRICDLVIGKLKEIRENYPEKGKRYIEFEL